MVFKSGDECDRCHQVGLLKKKMGKIYIFVLVTEIRLQRKNLPPFLSYWNFDSFN